MQGQALNIIRPCPSIHCVLSDHAPDTLCIILQPIQSCMYTQKYWYLHLANIKRSLQVFFLLLHVWSDCNKLSVTFDNDNDIKQNVEMLYDTCTCINKTSVTWKTDHGFKKYIQTPFLWPEWLFTFNFYHQLLLINKIIEIHVNSGYLNFIS